MPNFVDLTIAADELSKAKRVMVIGSSGAGKSTLSSSIAKTFDMRHISLDRDMRWLPGWQVRDRDEQRRLHDGFCDLDRWVIEGTSISLFPTRLDRADLVIWLRPSRVSALWGVARRVAKSYGKVRADMADECPEILPDREFLTYIWTFEERQSPRVIEALNNFGPEVPVIQLRNHVQAAELMKRAQV